MRRFYGLILAAVLVFSLAGCGSNPPLTATTAAVTEPTVTAAEETAEKTEESTPANSTFTARFIDVGQADAALIQCDGHYMLIDGGNKADSDKIYAILKRNEVQQLELVIGTHAHEDHIGGIPGALHYAETKKTLCPVTDYDSKAFEDFKNAADSYGGGITVPAPGDTYCLGSALVTILGLNNGPDTNDTSIVLRIDYGSTSFLFTGDAEELSEKALTDSNANLKATVLKVGHHGSDTSTGYKFLREVMPEYGVISCGKDNSYGHPDEAVLSRLRDADVEVFRTDLQGDILCTSDGEKVTLEPARNKDADTLAPAEHPQTEREPAAPPEETNEAETQEPPKKEPDNPPTEPAAESNQADYVLNTNSMKFHSPDCSSVDRMSPANRKDVHCLRDELIAQGYEPCKRCNP